MTVAAFSADRAAAGIETCDAWVELYLKDPTTGAAKTYYLASRDLDDDDTYYGGFKDGRVLKADPAVRGLTWWQGQIQSNTWSFTFDESTVRATLIRQLLTNPLAQPIKGATVVYRILPDAQRRAGDTPITAFRGVIHRVDTTSPWQTTIYCEDAETDALARTVPKRRVQDIFSLGGIAAADLTAVAPVIFGSLAETGGAVPMIPLGIYSGSIYGFLVCRHAVKAIHAVYHNGVAVSSGEWGSAWFAPGQTGYSSVSATPYVDVTAPDGSTIRCTIVFAIGPEALDGPFTCDVDGLETAGDGSGTLVTSIYDQILYFLGNFGSLAAEYTHGAYAYNTSTVPTFADSSPMINTASFSAAATAGLGRFGSNDGAWMTTQSDTLADILQGLALSAGADLGCDREGRFIASVLDLTCGGTGVPTWTFTEQDDLYQTTFQTTDNPDSPVPQLNTAPYAYRPNYAAGSGYLGSGTGLSLDSIALYGSIVSTSQVTFDARRASGPPPLLLNRALIFAGYPYRLVTIVTGLHASTVEPGDTIALTTREGLAPSPGGWVNRIVRAQSVSVDVVAYTVTITALDLRIDNPLVQYKAGHINSGTTLTIALDTPPANGNTLTIHVGMEATGITITGLTGGGVTWTSVGATATSPGSRTATILFGAAPVSNGGTSIVITFSGSGPATAVVAEWTQLNPAAGPQSGSVVTASGSSGPAVSAIGTNLSGQLVLVATVEDSGSASSPAGTDDFIQLTTGDPNFLAAYRVMPASVAAQAVYDGSISGWATLTETFQRAA